MKAKIIFLQIFCLATFGIAHAQSYKKYSVNLANGDDLRLYWHNPSDNGYSFGNIKNLYDYLKSNNSELLFAANAAFHEGVTGGFYFDGQPMDFNALENPLDPEYEGKNFGYHNFKLPNGKTLYNGVFYVDRYNKPHIVNYDDFKTMYPNNTYNGYKNVQLRMVVQSGHLLVNNGDNPNSIGSSNVAVRNGIGITRSGNILFVISTTEVNFYDFAQYFINNDCNWAMYIDGNVSEQYDSKTSNINDFYNSKSKDGLAGIFAVVKAGTTTASKLTLTNVNGFYIAESSADGVNMSNGTPIAGLQGKTKTFAVGSSYEDKAYNHLGLKIINGTVVQDIINSPTSWQTGGVFYITKDNKPYIDKRDDFIQKYYSGNETLSGIKNIKLATQSPRLIVKDGAILVKNDIGITRKMAVCITTNNTVKLVYSSQLNDIDFSRNLIQQQNCKDVLLLQAAEMSEFYSSIGSTLDKNNATSRWKNGSFVLYCVE